MLLLWLVFIVNIFQAALACGGITHIEISYRALNNFRDVDNTTSYNVIARENQDALEAGSSYPDAFYPSICFGGDYHDVSEDTHWTPFINASINYIRKHYPKPWNPETKKLVAFLMGSVSHAVADISWHSLGIKQGFLSTMSKTNYHGDYPTAHSDGDLGGDVLNLFQLNLDYSDVIGEWYVPTKDLANIYQEYYGTKKIDESVIDACTRILYLAKVGERLAVKKYFPITASKSPFLLDELYEYFLGGIQDMSAWTRKIWKFVTGAIEHGQENCDMPENPLYIRCNKTSKPRQELSMADNSLPKSILKYDASRFIGDFLLDDIKAEKSGRGMVFKPTKKLKDKYFNSIKEIEKEEKMTHLKKYSTLSEAKSPEIYPKAVFTIASNYAKLGRAYAVADLDKDGNDDVVIGAPGHYSESGEQTGMVFILYGTANGLNTSTLDIEKAADVKIEGPGGETGANSQFGSSLAIFDLDKDGNLDIAVGAPSYGSENLTYQGQVFVYSVSGRTGYTRRGAVKCQDLYCNLGYSLATGDVNSDLYHDLIIASPFAPSGGEQRGLVSFVHSNSKYQGKSDLLFDAKQVHLKGNQNYGWFGKSVTAHQFSPQNTIVAVGEPNYDSCPGVNCSQAIGQTYLLKVQNGSAKVIREIKGDKAFQMMGATSAFGRPYDHFSNIMAINMPGNDVKGHIAHIPVEFSQVGSVVLYNISDSHQNPIAVFDGNRRYGRFGAHVKFADLNRDGFDDFIVGAPLWTSDITEEITGAEQGRVYIYLGGTQFPRGKATSNCGFFHMVEPCPDSKASYELALGEQFARFGSQMAIVRTKNKVSLLVTAEHSSKGGRLSGSISVYEY